ncbi:MAG: hypothetical protein HYX92_18010 [Chloroflexi bacterium]|nr:hypothetical protein [Chloroflexota bacterium]
MFIVKRLTIVLMSVSLVALLVLLWRATPSEAMPDYAAKTGQACGTCHVNPAGGGTLTATGQAFAAIPTHISDPAGAWAQVAAAPAPAPAPVPAPAPAPAAARLTVSISGASADGTVTYSVVVSNPSDQPVADIYVAGSVPAGATFSAATNTPGSAGFFSSEGGSAAWLVGAIPARGTVGPFAYRVNRGSATDLSVVGFVHWLQPNDGNALSSKVPPISNAERLAIDQAISDDLNAYSSTLAVWRVQPGTAPQMMALADHFNLMWFAAQAGNWVFTDFEVYRADETLKVIDVTRPARTAGLRAWWQPAEKELRDALKARDLAAFTAAYDRAIAGCNSCHIGSVGGGISLKGVKVIRPTTPILSNLDYAGN